MTPDWIAVDWGTSQVRAWAMHGDTPLAVARSDAGMGTLSPGDFEAALLTLVQDWLPDSPIAVVICGMAGARQGWQEAPYASVPCAPDAGGCVRPQVHDPRLDVRILAGLKQDRPADVMRGEETQIAGVLAQDPRFDGVLCLPGTHTKWVQVSAGEVVSFRTSMTGEIFALLANQSVLRHGLSDGWDDAAFADAVAEAMARPEALAVRLFGLRAEGLLHGLSGPTARARLSGLLIGAELAALRPYWLGQRVAIIGDAPLCDTYAAALTAQGLAPQMIDASKATLSGLTAAHAKT
ncbi:2-dehydro-3-deoxygalactonokinase [Mesobacterium sp. TK19101]|uniref:2-dehydro-3-deoxygalactonokinase n=1 Tax=Mesobacterium hydrothermale TaxID=3111907 RepID=A0ABU6HB19_9RHOB|nr:2-dehydro-3-deoxygalactonokinase [Mesobacterium sp. TK19101]MEC3859650.1 2-dehydro-3-deoxygalactonokinase [Mesobacterium sp. TK19101]